MVPPYDLDAERAVLASIFWEPGVLEEVQAIVAADQFYHAAHRRIFEGFVALAAKKQPIDTNTLTAWLRTQQLLADVGGTPYLATLFEGSPVVAHVAAYAEIVVSKFRLRTLITTCQRLMSQAYVHKGDVQGFLDQAEQQMFEIARRRDLDGLTHVSETLRENFKEMEEWGERGEAITGTPTGFRDLDKLTSGMHPTDLVILAARPGMGKCLTGDTEIVLADGRLAPLAEIVAAKKARLLTLHADAKLHLTEATAFLDDGIKPTFRVTTRLGRVIETTLTHPFLTPSGWRSLGLLSPEACIAVPRVLPVFGDDFWPQGEVALLGYLLGGIRTQDHLTALGTSAVREAQAAATEGMDVDAVRRRFFKTDVAHERCVPAEAFSLRREQLALLLNRLFWAAGCIGPKAPASLPSGGLRLSTLSERLARQVAHLLLRFGVVARIERTDQVDTRWSLVVSDRDSLISFRDQIALLAGTSGKTLCVRAEQERFFGSLKDFPSANAAMGDVFWDEIVSIVATGNKQVYDLTIDGTHNFIAADVCVHNTSFATGIAVNAARPPDPEQGIEGHAVAVFSLEMPKKQIVNRMAAAEAKIDVQSLRNGKLADRDWPAMAEAASFLGSLPIFTDDSAGITVLDIRGKLRRLQSMLLQRKTKLALVVIDYLQLMRAPEKGQSREQEIAEISRGLKGMAKELEVPVMALSQLNRSVEQRADKRPMMSDLRESGALEQDADTIIFLYRDGYYNKDKEDTGETEVIVAKQRNGPTGKVLTRFEHRTTRFYDLENDTYQTD